MNALRPYQTDAVSNVRMCMQQGARRVVLVMPTGSGKTCTGAEIVRRANAAGKRCLWLSHRIELIEQSAATLMGLGLDVGVLCASSAIPSRPDALTQVASVQTLLARNQRPPADLIVFDEAHHAAEAAEQWSALLKSYKDAYVIGLTATPERGDGCGLEGCFDAIVVGATVKKLTDEGHLVPCTILRPPHMLGRKQIAQHPVDIYMKRAMGRRAIVFARSIELSESYAEDFRTRGVQARSITADTPWAERRLYIDAFRRGDISVLCNIYVLTEGFDAPETDCVIMARGAGSPGMYLQMVGRSLRPAPGKTDALLLDLRGITHLYGRPEDERIYSLDGQGIRQKDPNCYCPVCGAARTSGEGCRSCGWEPEEDDTPDPDRVTNTPLVAYEKKRAESYEEKLATVGRWLSIARERGYKAGWIFMKYKAVYACTLSAADYYAAERRAKGAAA